MGGGGWSPDSKQIVFFYGEDQGRRGLIRTVDIEDSSCKTVKEFDSHNDGALADIPRWSPDGTKILFRIGSDIWVIDTSGQNLKRLAKVAMDPNWSPDGEQIIYTAYRDEEDQLWIMNANGRKEHPLGE